jgi:hypothetical protein
LILFAAAVLLTVGAIAFTLFIREKDVPQPEATTGYEHLEQRRARIYENLRDLQFEYRVGKLSEADYQTTKQSLQGELAAAMAEIDKLKGLAPPQAKPKADPATTCPHCGAKFPAPMKFCGECGKAMA